MSTLVSSSVSGRRTAPKAPPRRRVVPPPASAATPVSVSSAPTSVAPPSPPPTQQPDTPTVTPAPPAEHPATSTTVGSSILPPTEGARAPSQPAEQQVPPLSARPSAPEQPVPPPNEQPIAQDEHLPDAPPSQPPKRKARVQASAKESSRPAKRVKRSSARSNALVQSESNEEDVPIRTHEQQVQAPNTPASTTPTEHASALPKVPPAKRKATRRSTRKSAATVIDSDAEFEAEAQPETETPQEAAQPRGRRKTAAKSKPRVRKAPRQVQTPAESGAETEYGNAAQDSAAPGDDDEDSGSDPEFHEIDPKNITMFGLSYDKRHGKTSEREKKMAEIDWAEVARQRYDEMEAAAAAASITTIPAQPVDVRETTEGPSGTAESRPSPAKETTAPTEEADDGPTFRIVNGQIVADDTSLVIDRHAQAEEEAAEVTVPVVEDNDLTRRINQMTWVNSRRREVTDRVPVSRAKGDPWSEEETERFYDALKMFGTDFYIISKMFAPRTRKQIKKKFNREERLDHSRVNAALAGKQTGPSFDLDFYAKETGRSIEEFRKFEGLDDVERVIRESMKEKEAAMQEAIREEEEAEESIRAAEAARERNKKKKAEREPKAKGKRKKTAGGGIGANDGVADATAGADEGEG